MKSIENYNTEHFSVEDIFRREGSLRDLRKDFMWVIDGNERVEKAIEDWLAIDASDQSKNILFKQLFFNSFLESNLSIFSTLFKNSFKPVADIFSDTHRAFIWSNISTLIPSSGPYKYLSHILTCATEQPGIPNLQYKEFKSSMVDRALSRGEAGFINLLYLHDKKLLNYKNLHLILQDNESFNLLSDKVIHIKFPEHFNSNMQNLFRKLFKSLDVISQPYVIYSMMDRIIKTYGDKESLSTFVDSEVSNLDKKILIGLKKHGILESLLANKMEHQLSLKDKIVIKNKI